MSNDNNYIRPPLSPASSEDTSDREYLIGDLAREFGVSLRTLRFYESRGLLKPRREGLARIYGPRDRERLAAIMHGKRLGFTLTEIAAMLAQERDEAMSAKLSLSLEEVEDQIQHLETQKEQIESALDELKRQRDRLRTAA